MRPLRLATLAVAFLGGWVGGPGFAATPAPSAEPPIPVAEPPMPIAKSPVAIFRELLAMNATDRKKFLDTRPAENQKLLQRKLQEYEALAPNEREWRLQATELRWYLLPLMSSPPTNRPAQLKLIPTSIRPLVLSRLRSWDSLPDATRQALLDNEAAVRYFTAADAPPLPGPSRPAGATPAVDARAEASLARWRALPPAERSRAQQRFNQFFELSTPEKERALRTLSEEERRQIEKTLQAFANLPPAQRAECVRAFDRFAGLSTEERRQFLRNAERWSQMPPAERNAWRDLVDKLAQQPPYPPVVIEAPPAPPGSFGQPARVAATNR